MNEETFWVVRKPGATSRLEKQSSNPIKTSYELLWAEVRSPGRSSIAIQNAMRRILENYFKILGGIDLNSLCEMFEGKDKAVCNSLCSWINAGSHHVLDDAFVSIDDSTVSSYRRVFRSIFEKAKHAEHFKMMMGDDFIEGSAQAS